VLLLAWQDTGENSARTDWAYGEGSRAEKKAEGDHQVDDVPDRLAGGDTAVVVGAATAARAENAGSDNAVAGEGEGADAVCRRGMKVRCCRDD
jgi:hypothetical protein